MVCSVGLTWEDDATQQVLSKELSKLRRIPYRPQQNGAVYNTNRRSDAFSPVSVTEGFHYGPERCMSEGCPLLGGSDYSTGMHSCPYSFFFPLSVRPVAVAMDPVDQRVKPVEAELSRNLQTYLQRLGLLPRTAAASSLSPQEKVWHSLMSLTLAVM